MGGLGSLILPLPVPSPDEGGGFLGEVSNLISVKSRYGQRTNVLDLETGQSYLRNETTRT